MGEHELEQLHRHPHLVKKRARMILFTRLWRASLTIGVALTLIFVIYSTIVGNDSRDAIEDCTTPEGECYQRGQQQTGDAVGIIIERVVTQTLAGAEVNHSVTREIIILSDYCQDQRGAQTLEEVERCVNEELAKKDRVAP